MLSDLCDGANKYMNAPHNPLSMASLKDISLVLAMLLILLAAAFAGFPLYVHEEVSKATGAYAPLYLYEYSPYDTIAVEVHYQADAAPSDAALSGLNQTLASYTGKRVEVRTYGDLPGDAVNGQISDDNVSAIGGGIIDKYGREHMGWLGGSIPIYIIYVNAQGPDPRGDGNDTVVGISYRADSFFILKNHIDGEGLEKAVLIHEAGHILGLEHDDDQGCVMASVMVEKRSWMWGRGGPPVEFCENHTKELNDRRHDLFYNAGQAFSMN
jgi:hypothetical protein